MVIGSLIAFVVLLAAMSVLLTRLWQSDSLAPVLRIGPGLSIGVADSVAVGAGGGPAVAEATVAEGAGPALAAAAPAAGAGSGPGIGISANRVVSVQAASPGGRPPGDVTTPEPAPVEAPSPPAQPGPSTPAPVVVADTEDGQGRPGTTPTGGPPRTAARVPTVGGAEFEIADGGEYRLSFRFISEAGVYGEPGGDNLIVRLGSEGAEPALGLQLWEFPGEDWYGSIARGLWSSGEAMEGERFLAPTTDDVWHQLVIDFRASSQPDGYYVVSLDGHAIDARAPVSLIAPGSLRTVLEVGLFRDEPLEVTPGLQVSGARLTQTTGPAQP